MLLPRATSRVSVTADSAVGVSGQEFHNLTTGPVAAPGASIKDGNSFVAPLKQPSLGSAAFRPNCTSIDSGSALDSAQFTPHFAATSGSSSSGFG